MTGFGVALVVDAAIALVVWGALSGELGAVLAAVGLLCGCTAGFVFGSGRRRK